MTTPTPTPDAELTARLALLEGIGIHDRFDARRFEWLASLLRESGQHHAARLADEWARESLALARRRGV